VYLVKGGGNGEGRSLAPPKIMPRPSLGRTEEQTGKKSSKNNAPRITVRKKIFHHALPATSSEQMVIYIF
jgi:hypothetical protein